MDTKNEIFRKIKQAKAGLYVTMGITLVTGFISIASMIKTKSFDFLIVLVIALIITSFMQYKKLKKLQQELNSIKE